jgi:hypothetical protein
MEQIREAKMVQAIDPPILVDESRFSRAACFRIPSLPCHIPPRDMRKHPVGGRSNDLDRVRT